MAVHYRHKNVKLLPRNRDSKELEKNLGDRLGGMTEDEKLKGKHHYQIKPFSVIP